jgi:PAS domain S-box-containing protein
MADNAGRLASDDPLNPLMGGKDELAQLDQAFHRTARALAEARKRERAVFDNCRDVLCVLSSEGQFVSINSAVEDAWGYSKKELQALDIKALIHEEDLPAALEVLRKGESASPVSHECRVIKKNAELINTLWSVSHKSLQKNSFCVVHDITDRKALEQMRQEFLGMVSHDLRTPLTAIKGVAQLILAGSFGKLEPEANERVREIVVNSDALLELINDILDLEKLDAGKMQLSLEPVEMDEIVESVQKLVSNSGARLKIQNSSGYLAISADKDRLSHAISNLCKYLSFRAEEDLPVQLRIKQNNGDVQISILDEGPVLNESLRRQLFQKIKENAFSEKTRNSCFHPDLALPLAARTVESHGGAIAVEPGDKGNVFLVTIPVLDD